MNGKPLHSDTDVLVVGGGPAGATASALLARRGLDVTLLEKARFPRYHIGESLLPSLLPLLDLVGAREGVERRGFVRKTGAYYDWGGQEWALRFGGLGGLSGLGGLGHDAGYSFQVVRSEFDDALLGNARNQGVRVHEETAVREVHFRDGRATGASWASPGASGTISFRHLVDASGRAGLLAARQLRSRRFHDAFRNVAAWGYWEGAGHLDAAPSGAICLFSLPDDGWLWAIPLHDGTLSVGLVTDKHSFAEARRTLGDTEAVYTDRLHRSPRLADLLAPAQRKGPLRVETDYSYVADRFCGPGWLLAGDAACFLDPLLSTGVHLAMYSGMLAAASLSTMDESAMDQSAMDENAMDQYPMAEGGGAITENEALAFYEGAYRHAYERLFVLVGAFYDIHQGRDAHFRRAQTLSHRDQAPLRLHESFLHIISGMEDFHDAQDDIATRLFTALRAPLPGHRPVGLGGHGASMMTPWPTLPERAVAGLRLALRPHLCLRRADGAGPSAGKG